MTSLVRPSTTSCKRGGEARSGRLELDVHDFDLREIVEDTAEMVAHQAHAKGLELTDEMRVSIAARRLSTLFSFQPSRPSRSARCCLRRKMSAGPCSQPRPTNSSMVFSPSPSMSIAPRDPKCSTRRFSWAGHCAFTQRTATCPSSFTTLLPQTGSLAFLGPPEFAGVDLADFQDVIARTYAERLRRVISALERISAGLTALLCATAGVGFSFD